MNHTLTITDSDNIPESFWTLLDTVPFGNSAYATENMVLAQLSDSRTYRQALLELHQKTTALHKARCGRDRTEIDIRKKKKELDHTLQEDDQQLLRIDIREKEFELKTQRKLVKDTLIEVQVILNILGKCPVMTRQEFENAEPAYWLKRAKAQAQRDLLASGHISQGNQELLEAVALDPVKEVIALDHGIHTKQRDFLPTLTDGQH